MIRQNCRVCSSKKLDLVLSLGKLYISNFVQSKNNGIKASLDLVVCKDCSLVQLKHTAVDPEKLYRNYWYKSGMNQTMINALADITKKVERLVKLKKNDIVLDIGANDGTLLRTYKSNNIIKVGFEPALNLVPEAEVNTDRIICNFFNFKEFSKYYPNRKAKIITSIAMFYDLEEPNKFVEDIRKTLDNKGIWIIQMAYLPLMLKLNAFDNICHEHIEYYSLLSLENLLKIHQLEAYNVELNDINGGSFRVYIKHKNSNFIKQSEQALQRLEKMRSREKKMGLETMIPYKQFEQKVITLKKQCYEFIKRETKKGKTVSVYGASTKGNTLLQFYNLNNKLIKNAAERNPSKWGLKTIGTGIPIVSEIQVRNEKPDYLLILPWHFLKEFKKREHDYFIKGGHFIVPLPDFKIL